MSNIASSYIPKSYRYAWGVTLWSGVGVENKEVIGYLVCHRALIFNGGAPDRRGLLGNKES